MKKGCIIYCIEKGLLEQFTLLSIASIKKYGGIFTDYDIFCVQPRKEFSISSKTKKILSSNDIHFIDIPINTKYRFYKLANKPLVCEYIYRKYQYQQYVFLDSDTIILNEPIELINSNADISIQKNFRKGIGVNNEKDHNYDYWKEIFELAGSNIHNQPKIITRLDKKEIISYWNSAVISVRNGNDIFLHWSDLVQKVLQKNLHPKESIYFVEESCLSVSLLAQHNKIHTLPIEYNFPLEKEILNDKALLDKIKNFDDLVILHHLNELSFLLKIPKIYEKSSKFDFILQKLAELNINPNSKVFHYNCVYQNLKQGILERLYYFLYKTSNKRS